MREHAARKLANDNRDTSDGGDTDALATRIRPTGRIPRAAREQQLLDIAEDLFARHGYDAVSIEDVARHAGITRPVVYDHFGSKDGLYLACARRARAEFEQSLQGAVTGVADPREQLLRGGDAFFQVLERDPRRWAILFGVSAPLQGEFGEALNELRSHTIERIVQVLQAIVPGTPHDELSPFAHALSGAGEQLGRWWLAHPDVPRARVAELFRDFAWSGVQPLLAP
jgi:AcrR family transcriptional regulator